jgi:DNA (cytosine-5)-methyltransferase 1
MDFAAGRWQPIEKPGRAVNTLARIAAGRRVHGERFISSYYGAERGGRSIHRPVGTVTTRDWHAIVDGDRMRMFSAQECRAAMGFPANHNCRRSTDWPCTCWAMQSAHRRRVT